MEQEFKNKVVIVTGGATGMGRAAALAFGERGAKVVVATGRNVEGGEATVTAIREAGGEACFVRCDVSDEEQVKNLVSETLRIYGRLDCAFNNAGVGPDGVRMHFYSLTETPVEDWDKTMAVNARGCFLCMKHEIPAMLKSGGGAIVNTASVGGIRMAPGFASYGASKAAVIAATRTAALECARQGIRVNAVCPGPTLGTELMKNSLQTGGPASGGEHVDLPIPLGKMGQTEDITNAVVWLCSEKAGHITGHALSVDGGMADIG